MTKNILQLNHQHPQHEHIKKASDIIKIGGVVLFPTWCLYGLAADAFNEIAIQRIFSIKKRTPDNPLLILIKDALELENLVSDISESARTIMDHFWPGKVTLVFHARDIISDSLTARTGKIGIRLPEHPVARALLRQLENPITGTSANISHEPASRTIKGISDSLIDTVDLTLDSGTLKGGTGSTIVDTTVTPPVILREGEVSKNDIFNCINNVKIKST